MSDSSSRSRPGAPRLAAPQAALDALLVPGAANPIRRALWLDTLDLRLRPHLPPSLAAHARLANVDGARLVFLVDSPVWHARLRLAGPELLAAARSVGLDVTELVVKTTMQPLRPVVPPRPSARPAALVPAAAREAFDAALASLRDQQDPAGGDK